MVRLAHQPSEDFWFEPVWESEKVLFINELDKCPFIIEGQITPEKVCEIKNSCNFCFFFFFFFKGGNV